MPESQTYVYFIQGDPGGPVKIGYTNQVGARVRTIQTGNPQELRLLSVLPAPPSVETAYHRLLQTERVRGEWFVGPETFQLVSKSIDLADSLIAAYGGSGCPPDIFDFDPAIERQPFGPQRRPVEAAAPRLEVIRVPIRKRRVSGDFFGRGLRQSWREKPAVDAPVTVKFVDPETLRTAKPEPAALKSSLGGGPWHGRAPDWLTDGFDAERRAQQK